MEKLSTYVSPEIKVMEIDAQNVICTSGNDSMHELDYGNGGFSEQ